MFNNSLGSIRYGGNMRRTNIVNTYVVSLYEQKSVEKEVIHECDSMYEIYTYPDSFYYIACNQCLESDSHHCLLMIY